MRWILAVLSSITAVSVSSAPAQAVAQDLRSVTSGIVAFQSFPDLINVSSQRVLQDRAGVEIRSTSLADALHLLQARTGTRLLFSPSLFPEGLLVSCECRELSVRQSLESLL